MGWRNAVRLLGRHTWRLPVVLAVAVGFALNGGCSNSWVIVRPARPPLLPPEVDALVVKPFIPGEGVQINAADQALFEKQLRDALDARANLSAYDQPPTRLPNMVIVTGTWHRFSVAEQQSPELALRTIDLGAELTVRGVEDNKVVTRVSRRLVYQRVYPPTQTVSARPLDLGNAFGELAGQLVQALAPSRDTGPIVLQSAYDPESREALGVPNLLKGNRFAVVRLYDQAEQLWRLVLFNPDGLGGARTYRVSQRTLVRLRQMDVSPEVLSQLEPMMDEEPRPLFPFREQIRERLGGPTKEEGLILTLSDYQADRAHLNLAAAHLNLAAVYQLDKRYDLAAYHLVMAYVHEPRSAILEEWGRLQRKRRLLPGEPSEQEMMRLYQRIPPPGTVLIQPGAFDQSVLPPPVFARGGVNAASGAPVGAQTVSPQPVGPPPPSGQGDVLTPAAPTPVQEAGVPPAPGG